ncbi:MAG: caspase family protein [Terasakiella sp.]|uniref:caspase family protein n=1 Tax=unclassified Terasakiella TaxID=2614952 RepID=UPI003AFFA2E6
MVILNTRLIILISALASLIAPAFANDDIAVIIGNKTYQDKHIPDSQFSDRDAFAIRNFMEEVRHIKSENIIYFENATQAQMTTVFGNEQSYKGRVYQYVKPNVSNLFIYYSGHGFTGLTNKKRYLLPTDADISTVEINGFPLEVFTNNLFKSEAKTVTVFLDTGFSGHSHNGPLIKNASGAQILSSKPSYIKKKDVNLLIATSDNQIASKDEINHHGLFTEFLLQALYGKADVNKDNSVTLGEAYSYLNTNMRYEARRVYMREQMPSFTGDDNFAISIAYKGPYQTRKHLSKVNQIAKKSSRTKQVLQPKPIISKFEKRLTALEHKSILKEKQNKQIEKKISTPRDALKVMATLLEKQYISKTEPVSTRLRYDNINWNADNCSLQATLSFHHAQRLFSNNQSSGIDIRNHQIEALFPHQYETKERLLNSIDDRQNIIASFTIYRYGPFTFINKESQNSFKKTAQSLTNLCKK